MSGGHPFRADRSETEKKVMCKVIEDMRNEVAEVTAWRTKVEVVKGMYAAGASKEMIAKGANLTIEQVEEIIGEKSA